MNAFKGRAICKGCPCGAFFVLFLFCIACTAEPVSFGAPESLVAASGVELAVAMDGGVLSARGKKLIVKDGNGRMRLEGDASVTLDENTTRRPRGMRRPVFSARARQIEIDTNGSTIELKGEVHTRFAGAARIGGDAGF
ncbi:MAG: hypothetical protein GY762_05755 [Proteobacteria bacterium]|nr:hypothetical protein [Pseudomonadota bacterium]